MAAAHDDSDGDLATVTFEQGDESVQRPPISC